MADPISAAVIGGVGAAAQGVGAGLSGGGGGGGQPQVKLPPELEAQQLEIIKQNIATFQQESARAGDIANMMQNRANLLDQVAQGYIPYSEAENSITALNRQIAEKYGAETLEVLGFGQELRTKAEEMLRQPLAEFKDPAVEREINDFQRTMEEQMSRDYGPDWRNTEAGRRAAANFSQTAAEMRSQASRQMRAEELGTLTGLTNIGTTYGQGIFQGAGFGQEAMLGGMSTTSQLASQTAAGAAEIGGRRLEYAQFPMGLLQDFGRQDLSKDIRGYIGESGAGGMFPEFQTYGEYKKRTGTGGWGQPRPEKSKSQYYGTYQWGK